MIRLTLTLLAGIAVTLSVAGRPLEATETADITARAETDLTDPTPGRLALDDEVGAIERAIAATENYEAPEEEPVQLASLGQAETVEQALPRATVNAARVNLRAGPSTANQVLDQVVRNDEVRVLEATDDGWSRIEVVETGTKAWIFDRFLTPQG